MSVKYFVDENLIPKDGSREIIEVFNKEVDFEHSGIYIYPDVHYKKGSRVVNGMLIASSKYIFPACLGVANCGFTFGKLNIDSDEKAQNSFDNYSKILTDYASAEYHSASDINNLFRTYLEKDFVNKPELYEFLEIKSPQHAYKLAQKCLTKEVKKLAKRTLCQLGGGNHFFEIQKVEEVAKENELFKKDDLIFILHSDSIGVGDIINLRYSNMSEWDFLKGWNAYKKRLKFRIRQFFYFLGRGMFLLSPIETIKLLYSQKSYRTIKMDSFVGKSLIFEHNLAALFGEMNRDMIIQNWAKTAGLDIQIVASHDHDSINVENSKIVQRNGVQYIGDDQHFMLPSAMGNYSYILENTKNKEAFLSTNHGCGRFQDKHIAREHYTKEDTKKELSENNIKLYRVGKGNIAEQNSHAFKDINSVIEVMEKHNLGQRVAKTKPIAIMKG